MLGLLITFAIIFLVCAIGIFEYLKHPKPPNGLTYSEYKEYYYNRGWEKKKSVTEYIEAGQKLQAIKELRAQTGCSLSDARIAVEQLEASLKQRDSLHHASKATDRILHIDSMDGHEFEYYCAELLKKDGFSEVSVTKGSGDQGVDILATKDGVKYAIQCKNYSSPLSNTPVQEVNAGRTFYNCHVGAVMTNSTFTPGAKALAQATGILLWDRSKLEELISKE